MSTLLLKMGFPGGTVVKNPPDKQEKQEMWILFLGQEDPLEKEMATHSSILSWKSPRTEKPGGLHTVHGVTKSRTLLSAHTYITEDLFLHPLLPE